MEQNANAHWIIGFSGGKDSTSLLKIFSSAAKMGGVLPAQIDVIYCDTGVENPVLDTYVKTLFSNLAQEFAATELPFKTHILSSPVKDRFFVKLIGRGYPPPTNSFRWCTKNLRIRPVSNFIKDAATGNAIVALGLRRSESQQRDRSLKKHGDGLWQEQVEGGNKYKIFLPILDFGVDEVWESIMDINLPQSIDGSMLANLYRGASGECPIIKAPQSPPCGSGRFGCWTCTVVRKDHSAIKLIDAGYDYLVPYLNFRNWLSEIRNDPKRRWPNRRSGRVGLGPFTLAARKEILLALNDLEDLVGTTIIDELERSEIDNLWSLDINSEPENY